MKLCGVDMPYSTRGRSLETLWNTPDKTHWKNTAYGYYRKGITVRTERYRLTRYFRDEQPTIELYDHATDPSRIRISPAILQMSWSPCCPFGQQGNTGLFEKQQEYNPEDRNLRK